MSKEPEAAHRVTEQAENQHRPSSDPVGEASSRVLTCEGRDEVRSHDDADEAI
jgi:hypothetical protein